MLIVLTGPASSGKDTILFKLLKKYPDLKRVITTTTRQKRPNETDGKDYRFVSREQFENMVKAGDFLEYVEFFNNLYGTAKKEIEPLYHGQNLIWRVETSRAAKINEVIPADLQNQVVVIYINVSDWGVLKERMKKRGSSGNQIEQRLNQDRQDFEKYCSAFTHIIYNQENQLDKTIEEITKVIDASSHSY